MTRVRAVLVALVLVAAAATTTVRAQAKPNFSGTWIQVLPADQAGETIVVKHDASSLTEEHASEGGGHVRKFALDGAEHTSEPVGMGSGHEMVTKHKASWTGSTLVVNETTDYQNGFHRVAKSEWSLDDKGQLVVSFAGNMPDGSQMKMTMVYRKK
jgi:hypothetical protein